MANEKRQGIKDRKVVLSLPGDNRLSQIEAEANKIKSRLESGESPEEAVLSPAQEADAEYRQVHAAPTARPAVLAPDGSSAKVSSERTAPSPHGIGFVLSAYEAFKDRGIESNVAATLTNAYIALEGAVSVIEAIRSNRA